MKSNPLWRVSVRTTSEAEDAVTESLQNLFQQPASSYTDVETRDVTVSVYLPNGLKRRQTFGLILRKELARIQGCGLNIGRRRISIRRVKKQDWEESWKRHFRPIEIGSGLLVKPSWSRRRPRKRQAVVVLDPGLSFGTGRHPTTAFCLKQLALRRNRAIRQSFLDIGTGSGILALAAAKLGYAPVEAIDLDPQAVQTARTNARRNCVKLNARCLDLKQLPSRPRDQFDVVCANLISTLLLKERSRILSRLKPRGHLIVAGILRSEFAVIQRCYERGGMRLVSSRADREWRSGVFVRQTDREACAARI